MENITQLRFFQPSPEIEFELDGSKYQISYISMEPYKFTISLMNRDEEVLEYDGNEYYYITRFNKKLWMRREFFDYLKQERLMAFNHPEIYTVEGASEEIMAAHQELSDKVGEFLSEQLMISNIEFDEDGGYHTIVFHQEPYSQSYDIFVELKPDCGAALKDEGPLTNRTNFNLEILDENTMEMTNNITKSFPFTSPIYVTDIKRVYITKTSDPDFELTIYEPDKDESLLAYLNGQS